MRFSQEEPHAHADARQGPVLPTHVPAALNVVNFTNLCFLRWASLAKLTLGSHVFGGQGICQAEVCLPLPAPEGRLPTLNPRVPRRTKVESLCSTCPSWTHCRGMRQSPISWFSLFLCILKMGVGGQTDSRGDVIGGQELCQAGGCLPLTEPESRHPSLNQRVSRQTKVRSLCSTCACRQH